MENATAAEHELAASMFDKDDDPDDSDGIYSDTPDGAVIRIDGPLSMTGPSPLARLFGYRGTGYRQIVAAAAKARERRPKAVTLEINSPGGEVTGVDVAWQAIQALAKEIPTRAVNMGMMASAAYWLASPAGEIVATSPAAEQGSIGVLIAGIDDSKMGEKIGLRRVQIVSRRAPDKAAGVDSAHGRELLQKRADDIEAVFLERVAAGRETTVDKVAANYGKGAVMIARDALRVGMIDDIVSAVPPARDQPAVSGAATQFPVAAMADRPQTTSTQDRRDPMTLMQLLQSDPQAKAEYDQAIAAATAAGAASVQARITSAKPFLALTATKDGYTAAEVAQIAKFATDVISGTEDPGSLRGFVRLVDMQVENRKLIAAQAETGAQPETPAQKTEVPSAGPIVGAGVDPAHPSPQAVAQAEAELASTIARDKAAAGRK